MKHLWKYLIATAVLVLAALAATGCSQWDTPYVGFDDEGYNVSVRFDAGGGVFAGTANVAIVDVFNTANYKTNANGQVEIPLFTPDDPLRGKDSAFEISKTDFFLAGWYTERTPRVDDAGNPLDAWGQPTAETGREQGYIYSGRWDFDKDRLTVDPAADRTAEEITLTLYAAWIPYFNYEFYAPDGKGGFEMFGQKALIEINLPFWNEKNGRQDLGDVPTRDGKTFVSAFLDEAMTLPAGNTVGGEVNYENGTASATTVKIYTTWQEGTWFHIYSAKQFFDNSRLGGHYRLCADLDFEGLVWSPDLAMGEFKGTIEGDGHAIKNVTVLQGDNSKINGGLFGILGAEATLRNVSFENITYKLVAGSRMQGPSYGLLCGSVIPGATFENVRVSGEIVVGAKCYRPNDYTVGLLAGTGVVPGVSHDAIKVTAEDPAVTDISVDAESGQVTVTFKD